MPVLVNQETGFAEDLPQEIADRAISTGSHALPLVDPEGKPVVASLDQAKAFLGQGYRQPEAHELKGLLDYSKFSSPTEQIKTGLEGAASAATFGLSTEAEKLAGVDPEDIRARRETNPGVHSVGQMAGLAGSALVPGGGAANILTRAGEGAAGALGLAEGTGLLSKVGSSAIKSAVETAIFQGGDEASKLFAGDPNQSVETALTDIGLSGLIGAVPGAAIGATSPLWKAASESKLANFLGALRDRANGVERSAVSGAMDAAIEKSGVEVAPEIKAAINGDPETQLMFQKLQESTTSSGQKAQAALHEFKQQANESVLRTLGKTEKDLDGLASMSEHDIGTGIKKTLSSELKSIVNPITEQFEKYKSEFSGASFGATRQARLSEDLLGLMNTERYNLLPNSPQNKLITELMDAVPRIETMQDLGKMITRIGDSASNPEMWNIGKQLKSVFRNAEDTMVTDLLGEKAPGLIAEHQAARSAYRAAMEKIDALNDRLHVGKYGGPGSFIKALENMGTEDAIRRLSPQRDAELLGILKESFPGTAKAVQEQYLNTALKTASQKASAGEAVSTKALFNVLEKWSPEIKAFALPEGAESKLSALKEMLDAVPQRINPSGTAKTLDALWSKVPAGGAAMVSALTGHNPLLGWVLGEIGHYVGREVPDAVKLATLRFLGDGQPINSEAFKNTVQLAAATIRGETALNKAAKALFRPGVDILPQGLLPTEAKREKIKDKLKEHETDISGLLNVGGQTGYYMPGHGSALGETAARATQYLNSLKPSQEKLGPLDPPRQPSKAEEAAYDRALDIAEQPLIAIKSIKEGTLTPQDVVTLKTIYPNLYGRLSQKLTNEMIEHVAKGESVPYSSRLSLSLFLGQPLDSTMTPQAIMATQPKMPAQAPQPQGGSRSTGSMKSLNKLSGMYATPSQSRQMEKSQFGS